MAAQYKRRISTEILKFVQSKCIAESEISKLERRLQRIVKVRPLRRDSAILPSLCVNGDDLRNVLQGEQLNLNEFQGWLQKLDSSNGNHYFHPDKQNFVQTVLNAVRTESNQYGYLDNRIPAQRVLVEFSAPNVAKPFHVGHLRSTIIGNVISNLYEAAGHNVKRINFLGDWGTQFGLLMLGLQKYSDQNEIKKLSLLEILKVYVQINKDVKEESKSASDTSSPTYQEGMKFFARLEKDDPELLSLWSHLRTLTVSELDEMYQRLGVRFTHTQYESDFRQKTEEILTRLHQANMLHYGEDGVGYVHVDNGGKIGRASVIKSDGSSLYLTRDIAAAVHRQELFNPDKMHYVVEMAQRSHFVKLVSILKQLNVPWAFRPIDDVHIRFGRVQGMSTRKGQAVHLQEVLDEAKSKVIQSMKSRESTRVTENVEDVADRLAVSSIVLQDLKSHRAKEYSFSWEKMLNFKADSGVFVQYCHARLCSMMNNCDVSLSENVDIETVAKEEPLVKLVIHMAKYPEVFDQSLEMVEPHHIVQYLFQLCHLINAAYAACPVKGENLDLAQARLLVFDCSRQVLTNCLQILGITPLLEI